MTTPRHVAGPVHQVSALGNRAFWLLSLLNGQVGLNQVLLTVVFPLWLVERTDAPHETIAWLYGTNTVLVVLLQVRTARVSETLAGALRAARLAVGAVVVACTLAMAATWAAGTMTIVAMAGAYVMVTAAELFSSASSWGLVSELTDPLRRAEYQGVWKLGLQLSAVLGPVLFTWLAIQLAPYGLLIVAAFSVVSVLAMPPVIARAREMVAAGAAPETNPGATLGETRLRSSGPQLGVR